MHQLQLNPQESLQGVQFLVNQIILHQQKVQDYIPLPLTMGCAMYYTGKAPDGSEITVNRGLKERRTQINMLKKQRSKGAGVKPAGFRPRGGNGQSTERRGRSSDTAERNFRDKKK